MMANEFRVTHEVVQQLVRQNDIKKIKIFLIHITKFNLKEINDDLLLEELVIFLTNLMHKRLLSNKFKDIIIDTLYRVQNILDDFGQLFLSCEGIRLCFEYPFSRDPDKNFDSLEIIITMYEKKPDLCVMIQNIPGMIQSMVDISARSRSAGTHQFIIGQVINFSRMDTKYHECCTRIGLNIIKVHSYLQLDNKTRYWMLIRALLMLYLLNMDIVISVLIQTNQLLVILDLFDQYYPITDLNLNKRFSQLLMNENLKIRVARIIA